MKNNRRDTAANKKCQLEIQELKQALEGKEKQHIEYAQRVKQKVKDRIAKAVAYECKLENMSSIYGSKETKGSKRSNKESKKGVRIEMKQNQNLKYQQKELLKLLKATKLRNQQMRRSEEQK